MDKNIERERILLIEEATLRIKAAITNSVMNKVHKVLVKDQCESIIKSTERKLKELKLDEELIKITLNALRSNYRIWYSQILDQLEKAEKNDTTGLVSDTLKAMKNLNYKPSKGGFTIATSNNTVGMEQIKVTNLREMMTIYDEGAAGRYVDYVGEIKKTLVNIQNEISNGTLSAIDSLGRKKSIRNMAEIKTRYDLINEDLNKLKEKGVEYVIATAHGNASERCSWWQGKIFKLDLDIETRKMGQYKGKPTQNKLGTIDGKPYYSLKEACENGFLSYNCQHRVVAYYKGVHVPKYNLVEVKKRRDITQKQRYLENKIRKAKSRQVLAISPEERKEAIEESKRLQADYRKFCEDNNVPRYDWRTRVTEVERDVSPVFDEKYEEELKSVDLSEYVELNEKNEYVVNFESINYVLEYARREKIHFKKNYSLGDLNSNISTVLNLRKELKPINPDNTLKKYIGVENIFIKPIESSKKREGTAVHIVQDNHKDMYFDKAKLATITKDLDKQEILALGVKKTNRGNDRFTYLIKLNDEHSTVLILDHNGNELEMVTAYAPTNKKAKKALKDSCIIFNNLV